MANMFSGNAEKRIPINLSECYKTDNTTRNLWIWCERLEKWGKGLFCFLIISGLIIAIASSITVKEVVKGTYYVYTETETSFDVAIFITSLIQTATYAFLEYCTYHVLALLVGSLATIVQNAKITANVALYNAAKEEGTLNSSLSDELPEL